MSSSIGTSWLLLVPQGSRATCSFLVPWALSASTSVCILCNIWILLLRVGAGPRIFHWLKVQSIVCLMWTSGSPDPWEPLWPLVEPCRSLWELGAHKSSQNLGSVGFWRRCALSLALAVPLGQVGFPPYLVSLQPTFCPAPCPSP